MSAVVPTVSVCSGCKCKFQLAFSAPCTLILTVSGFVVMLIAYSPLVRGPDDIVQAFAVLPYDTLSRPWEVYRLLSFVFAHGDWNHLLTNCITMLLVGPDLEARWGSTGIALIIASVTFTTGILNSLLLSTGLVGSSCITMALLLLSAFSTVSVVTDSQKSLVTLPFSSMLLTGVLIGRELNGFVTEGNVSRFSHLLGISCGLLWVPILLYRKRIKEVDLLTTISNPNIPLQQQLAADVWSGVAPKQE
jgi:rhomboid protease GluP